MENDRRRFSPPELRNTGAVESGLAARLLRNSGAPGVSRRVRVSSGVTRVGFTPPEFRNPGLLPKVAVNAAFCPGVPGHSVRTHARSRPCVPGFGARRKRPGGASGDPRLPLPLTDLRRRHHGDARRLPAAAGRAAAVAPVGHRGFSPHLVTSPPEYRNTVLVACRPSNACTPEYRRARSQSIPEVRGSRARAVQRTHPEHRSTGGLDPRSRSMTRKVRRQLSLPEFRYSGPQHGSDVARIFRCSGTPARLSPARLPDLRYSGTPACFWA